MKRFFYLLALLMLLVLPVSAATVQIGTMGTQSRSTVPANTNYPSGECFTLYKKAVLGDLEAGSVIKDITYYGYLPSAKSGGYIFSVYIANTDKNTFNSSDWYSGSVQNMTKFAEYTWMNPSATGSASDMVPLVTFTNDEGFEYTGQNLMVYIKMSGDDNAYGALYANFAIVSNTGSDYDWIGGYKNYSWGGWDELYGPPYGLPYTVLGIEGGDTNPSSCTVSGTVVSSKDESPISNANVTISVFNGADVISGTTDTSGEFSLTVDPVDPEASYLMSISAEGYEDYVSSRLYLMGSSLSMGTISMTKTPVPATLSGLVLDSMTEEPVVGASVTFLDTTVTSGDYGQYSFAIPNIDDLGVDDMTVTATAKGYLPYTHSLSSLTGGENKFNVIMEPVPELEGDGILVGKWNDLSDYSYYSPIYQLSIYTASQNLYPASLLGNISEGDTFSNVSFYGYYLKGTGEEGTEQRKFDVSFYLTNTDATSIGVNSPIDISGLTPLFEGEIVMPVAGSKENPADLINIELDTPFEYMGGNIAMIMVAQRTSTPSTNSNIPYFCTDMNYTSNVIYKEKSFESGFETAEWQNAEYGLPVMLLGGMTSEDTYNGTITGIITDKESGNAIPGATVTLHQSETETVSVVTTDSDGKYLITIEEIDMEATYSISFTAEGYKDESAIAVFTPDNLDLTINIEMEQDIEDGINTIESELSIEVYNAAGIRILSNGHSSDLNTLPAGLYIINGKKVLIK